MQLTGIFLIVCGLSLSARTLSQTVTFSGTRVPLEKIFSAIEEQTGYFVVFNREQTQRVQPVTVHAQNMPLHDFLQTILQDAPFKYVIEGKTLFVQQKEKEITKSMQPLPVSGIVRGLDGKPLANVSVVVKGTDKGTTTNADGFYSIEVNVGEVVVVSSIGYETREIKITEVKTLNFELQLRPESLDTAAVVSNGFQRLDKNKLIGSYSFVNNDLFNKRISTDVISRLEGNVPGLLFNRNTVKSRTNNGFDINIQGRNTLYADDQPLIVVDNFAYDGSLNSINPNDVESITVLKDASAASIWGVRSGNGVIVITTKKGKRNSKLLVDGNANVTITEKPDLFYNPSLLTSKDYISIEKQLFDSSFYYLGDPATRLSPVVEILADRQAGKISDGQANEVLGKLENYDIRNDLSRYIYRRSINRQYFVSLRGGSENNDYLIGVGFDDNLPLLIGNKNQRLTVNSQVNFYPFKKLAINTGVYMVYTTARNNGDAIAANLPSEPYTRLADDFGNPLEVSTDFPIRFKDSLTNMGLLNWKYKPLEEIRRVDQSQIGIDNRINVALKYNIINKLRLDIAYQYQRSVYDSYNYASDSTYTSRNLINLFSQRQADGTFVYPVPLGGILSSSNTNASSHQVRAQINYTYEWNDNEISAIAGSELRSSVLRSESNTAYGYDKDRQTSTTTMDFATVFSTYPYGGGRQIPNNQGFGKNTDNFLSYYVNAIYNYKNVYGASVSGRIDNSNLFGVTANQKAVPLYSLGVSYTMSNAGYYKSKWLTASKIRFSFGYNGNINKNATAVTTARSHVNAPFTVLDYAEIINPGNPALRWEKVQKTNIGYDFSVKNNLLFGTVDFYFKKGIDLFGNFLFAPSSGQGRFFGNFAGSEGNGFDLVLTSNQIKLRQFHWSSTLQVSHVVDKVSKSEIDPTITSIFLINNGDGIQGTIVPLVGKPLFGVYGFESVGLSHESGDPQGYLNGKPSTDYAAILKATTLDSLTLVGSARPTVFGSFRNNISFKRFNLSFTLIYKFNYYYRKISMSDAVGLNSDYLKRWQKPGDEANTYVPAILFPPHLDGNRSTFYDKSTALVEKADNIRLQDINLSYTISSNKLRFKEINVYAAAANLGLIWRANNDSIDPDVFYSTSPRSFPTPKSFTIGAKITL